MSGRRASGRAPYWSVGTRIVWREGSGPLGTGPVVDDHASPHFATPMTVLRDDADALVTWLPVGTPVRRVARADGRGKREDPATLFTAPTVPEAGVHELYDQLRVVPTGRPWSVWTMFAAGTPEIAFWYVNLERPHVRDDHSTYTSDHVLDLVVRPDRSVERKDEDELVLAVEQGVLGPDDARRIRGDADEVERLVARWAWPFTADWRRPGD